MKFLYNILMLMFVAILASFAIASEEVVAQAPTWADKIASFFEGFPAWITAILTVVTASSAIVKLTPTKKDDKVLEAILRVLNVLAINPSDKSKDKSGK